MDRLVFISHSSKDKAIADAIVHRLEEAGIRCWIAPRDIDSTDWAGSIMDGLRRSDVFVVVISRNSIESPEITKEVTEATRTCEYLLPFKVDDEMLSDRLQYHLGPCHWLDAVNPPLEKRIDELLERIMHLSEDDAVYMNSSRMKLVEKISDPRGLFVGREREIAAIHEAFEDGHIVFLQGMGGIGKSEIAKGYTREHRADYDTIIFASYNTNLMDLISGGDITVENLKRVSEEPGELWFRRKLEAIRSLVSERTLLIIDNFDVDEDEYMDEVFAVPCRILVTSRNDHTDYPTVNVGPIDDFDAVRKIFATHYGKPLKGTDQDCVDEILRLVGCHTITVELIAKQMKASFLKPEKMLARLRDTGVNMHLKEKVKREGAAEKLTGFDYIRQLFTFSALSDEERHMLEIMALVPVSGVDIHMFGEILDLDDYDVINELIGKSWLILDEGDASDEGDEFLRMHPVVRDVVKEELSVSPDSCMDYIDGLIGKSFRMWFFKAEEKAAFYSLVKQIMLDWPDPSELTLPSYVGFINIAWMGADFERAQEFGTRIYEIALRSYGEAGYETGRAALFTASAYHNAGDDIGAEPWYEKAYRHLKAQGGEVTPNLAQACFKVGRCAVKRGDLETAQHWYDEAMALYDDMIRRGVRSKATGSRYPDQYHDLLDDLATIERLKGNYAEAIRLEEQCCRQALEVMDEDSVAFAYYYLGMARCYSEMGDYERADELFEKTLRLDMKHHGLQNLQTMNCRESMADSLYARGDIEGAMSAYTALELDLEKYFGETNPMTLRIKGKMDGSVPAVFTVGNG